MPIDNVWVSLSYCFEVVVFDNTNPHWLLLAFAWIVNAKTLLDAQKIINLFTFGTATECSDLFNSRYFIASRTPTQALHLVYTCSAH